MMFPEHASRKTGPLEWLLRTAVLLLAAGIFYAGIRVILFMGSQVSTEQKIALRELERKRAALEESLDVVVCQAGFEKKTPGGEALFVPALVVELYNRSERSFESIEAFVEFFLKGQSLCGGRAAVRSIGPGETYGLVLKCVDITTFGSMIHGIKRHQLEDEVTFQCRFRSGGVDFGERSGRLDASPWTGKGKVS